MLPASRRKNPLLLLVEDDPGLREAVVRGLTKAGYLVAAAGSRREALESARQLDPDAVVMDVLLPDGVGPAVAE
jgi:DNA-binding response OmpR family regulator